MKGKNVGAAHKKKAILSACHKMLGVRCEMKCVTIKRLCCNQNEPAMGIDHSRVALL